ncbi:MAG: NTP transferase domain-containing protein [Thermodesulfobacteriota bacterium]
MAGHQPGLSQERAVAFVVARLNSSRLPEKHLRRIGDRSLLDWVIDHLRGSRELAEIVIATVAEPCNEPLKAYAERAGLACYWYEGDPDQVTTRLRRAAEDLDAEICVLVSGDCPLISGPALDHLIRQLRREPAGDYILVPPDEEGREAVLEGLNVARRRAWQLADDLSDTPELKEHQFPVIRLHPEMFQGVAAKVPPDLYGPRHRLSVDTYADLEFMNRVYEILTAQSRPFALPEVLQLLQEEPVLSRINAHVSQRQLKEIIHPVLYVADAGPGFGYGHLIRSQELALQLVERLSWPVTFLVDDPVAARLLKDRGLPVAWGALARTARPAPAGLREKTVAELLLRHDLLLLDIAPREVPAGWRQELGTAAPVIILDKSGEWAKAGNLIIFPGVTGPAREPARSGKPGSPVKGGTDAGPEILSGLEYVILRRDIRQMIPRSRDKDLDLLVYLHRPEQWEAVRSFINQHRLQGYIIGGFEPDFPQLLARARFLLSGFGYSFYEALALGTYPVTWPYSPAHQEEARRFYARLGLPPVIIETEADLPKILPLLSGEERREISLEDGTPALVQAIFGLMEQWPGDLKNEGNPHNHVLRFKQAYAV